MLLFWGCVHRSPNSHGENTAKPTKKRQTNSDHQTLWLGPFEQQRYKRWIRIRIKKQIRNTTRKDGKKSTPNDEYENFVNAHLEAAAKCISTKLKTKYRAVREKRALVKTASKNYRKKPKNTNALKLKTAQYQLTGIYIKEQTEYIQNQIDKIRDSVEDRHLG